MWISSTTSTSSVASTPGREDLLSRADRVTSFDGMQTSSVGRGSRESATQAERVPLVHGVLHGLRNTGVIRGGRTSPGAGVMGRSRMQGADKRASADRILVASQDVACAHRGGNAQAKGQAPGVSEPGSQIATNHVAGSTKPPPSWENCVDGQQTAAKQRAGALLQHEAWSTAETGAAEGAHRRLSMNAGPSHLALAQEATEGDGAAARNHAKPHSGRPLPTLAISSREKSAASAGDRETGETALWVPFSESHETFAGGSPNAVRNMAKSDVTMTGTARELSRCCSSDSDHDSMEAGARDTCAE